MDSNQGSNQNSNQSTLVKTNPVSNPTQGVTARVVSQGLVHGENPLDFINKNLKNHQPQEVNNINVQNEPTRSPEQQQVKPAPQTIISPSNAVQSTQDTIPTQEEPEPEPEGEIAAEDYVANAFDDAVTDNNTAENTENNAVSVDKDKEELDGDLGLDEDLDPNDLKELNFSKLRQKTKEYKQQKIELETQVSDLQNKVKAYETGEALPEVVNELSNRVQELEKFEQLHSLKTSPAYVEAYTKPIEAITKELQRYAKDYNIPDDIIMNALEAENVAELNQTLANHFDAVGASEVKNLLSQYKDINTRAKKAEGEPVKALASLQSSYKEIQEQQKVERRAKITSSAKNAWNSAYNSIVHEGKASELIFKDNDTEHNEQIAKPIVQSAAKEFGKIVKLAADLGMEELPDEFANALAKMTLLAHASATSIQTRDELLKELNTLKQTVNRTNTLLRPSVGGNISNASPSQGVNRGSGYKSPSEAAAGLIQGIINK